MQMNYVFRLFSNKLCSDVPTQIQALSSGVSVWSVTTGNSFGTVCEWQSYMADSRFPAMDGSTTTTEWSYGSAGKTGTVPSEIGLLTELTNIGLGGNALTSNLPSEIGACSKLSYLALQNNEFSGSIPSQIGTVSLMTWVRLRNNDLTLTIPTQVTIDFFAPPPLRARVRAEHETCPIAITPVRASPILSCRSATWFFSLRVYA